MVQFCDIYYRKVLRLGAALNSQNFAAKKFSTKWIFIMKIQLKIIFFIDSFLKIGNRFG
jgi:hypothetical protein